MLNRTGWMSACVIIMGMSVLPTFGDVKVEFVGEPQWGRERIADFAQLADAAVADHLKKRSDELAYTLIVFQSQTDYVKALSPEQLAIGLAHNGGLTDFSNQRILIVSKPHWSSLRELIVHEMLHIWHRFSKGDQAMSVAIYREGFAEWWSVHQLHNGKLQLGRSPRAASMDRAAEARRELLNYHVFDPTELTDAPYALCWAVYGFISESFPDQVAKWQQVLDDGQSMKQAWVATFGDRSWPMEDFEAWLVSKQMPVVPVFWGQDDLDGRLIIRAPPDDYTVAVVRASGMKETFLRVNADDSATPGVVFDYVGGRDLQAAFVREQALFVGRSRPTGWEWSPGIPLAEKGNPEEWLHVVTILPNQIAVVYGGREVLRTTVRPRSLIGAAAYGGEAEFEFGFPTLPATRAVN